MQSLYEVPLGHVAIVDDHSARYYGATNPVFLLSAPVRSLSTRQVLNGVGQSLILSNTIKVTDSRPATDEDRQRIAKALKSQALGFDSCILSISSGTDPEFWFEDAAGNMIPAFEVLQPKPKGISSALFYDGFQAEFTTLAHHCLQELGKDILSMLTYANELATKKGYRIMLKSTQPLTSEHLKGNRQHLALGCSPSRNVYGMSGSLGIDPEFIPIRFAGCHQHFGINGGRDIGPETLATVVKMLDRISGVCMTAMFGHLEDPARRQYYGLAGEHRLTSYGVEYRVPGPQILCHPGIYMLCFELSRMAVRTALNGLGPMFWETSDEETIEAINTSNQALARKIIERNEWILTNWNQQRFCQRTDNLRAVLYKGIEAKIANPTAVANNWRVSDPPSYTGTHYSWGHIAGSVITSKF